MSEILAKERYNKKHKKTQYKILNFNKDRQVEILGNILTDNSNNQTDNPAMISIPDQKFSEIDENVGALIWFKNPETKEIEILTGMETQYLTDKVVPEVKHVLNQYQIYSTAPSASHRPPPFRVFSQRAKKLTAELKIPIYFDQPKEIEPDTWTVNFRVIGEYPKWGIVKGSMELNENKKDAMIREIMEELFPEQDTATQHHLDFTRKLQSTDTTMILNKDTLYAFHYQLDKTEKNFIETHIAKLEEQGYGELVKYKFQKISDIFQSPNLLKRFNGKSQKYIHEFIRITSA